MLMCLSASWVLRIVLSGVTSLLRTVPVSVTTLTSLSKATVPRACRTKLPLGLTSITSEVIRGEEFVAVKDRGSTLNGEPIKVSAIDSLQEALLVTGFPYDHDRVFYKSFDLFKELYGLCQGIRRLGAAALDLCYVAAGLFEAFYEANLHPWDICAGDLICREAGGLVTDWRGGQLPFSGERILASNGLIQAELLAALGRWGPDAGA